MSRYLSYAKETLKCITMYTRYSVSMRRSWTVFSLKASIEANKRLKDDSATQYTQPLQWAFDSSFWSSMHYPCVNFSRLMDTHRMPPSCLSIHTLVYHSRIAKINAGSSTSYRPWLSFLFVNQIENSRFAIVRRINVSSYSQKPFNFRIKSRCSATSVYWGRNSDYRTVRYQTE